MSLSPQLLHPSVLPLSIHSPLFVTASTFSITAAKCVAFSSFSVALWPTGAAESRLNFRHRVELFFFYYYFIRESQPHCGSAVPQTKHTVCDTYKPKQKSCFPPTHSFVRSNKTVTFVAKPTISQQFKYAINDSVQIKD